MAAEREKTQTPSPFESLKRLLGEMPKPHTDKDYGRIVLRDRSTVVVSFRHANPDSHFSLDHKDHYNIEVYPPGNDMLKPFDSPDPQFFYFSVDENGLAAVSFPHVVVKIGDTAFPGQNIDSRYPEDLQEKNALGRTLVDWLDSVLKDGRYAKPPITASIFR